jgi:hypothetical protein
MYWDKEEKLTTTLTAEVLEDQMAMSLARVLAIANKYARTLGIEVTQSLITITQRVSDDQVLWRINYGAKDYVGRRGGDLIIEIDPLSASVRQVLQGQ